MKNMIVTFVPLVCMLIGLSVGAGEANNPILWADVPDVSMIRVGETYYMSSTTMHMSPGLPIMKSEDLVHWQIAGYAYHRLVENDAMNLQNNRNSYGRGSWASSLRYHDGTFYVSTFSATSGKTHVYSTTDIEAGVWKESDFEPVLHDNSLFFDDDGRVYMIYGGGKIRIRELTADASAIQPNGVDQVLIENANRTFGEGEVGGLPAEGSQLFKVNGKYYLFLIGSPRSRWSRTVLLYRADQITGPYEGRIVLQDQGIAQGGLIETSGGDWYAYLFGDRGAVGRIPYLVPVQWEDGWPVLGVDGKVPGKLELPGHSEHIPDIVTSDDFERSPGDRKLPLQWQWNHNPDNDRWSILQQPGRLRLTTGRVDQEVLTARNTLTQRTFGPVSSASVRVNARGMKEGDLAGLVALQKKYGFVGVKVNGEKRSIIAVGVHGNFPEEVETIAINQDEVHLKIDCDFRNQTDTAHFYYSLDGNHWNKIGEPLKMAYTMPHFMGYRFGLFNFATKTPGGHADFADFQLDDKINSSK